MTSLCYVNGRVTPESEAVVPIMDRGFLFGDGIYEVITTRGGRFFCMAPHLARLRRSAGRLGIGVPLGDDELVEICRSLRDRAGNADSYARIILTRGTGTAPSIDLVHAPAEPNLVIILRPLQEPPEDLMTKGLSAWVVDTCRNDRRSLDPAIKSGNYLNNILGLMEARRHGADTALFLNTQGQLAEAPTANLWLVRDGCMRTPALASGILAGITRGLLLEIGRREGLPMEEAELAQEDLAAAQEIFLSSTTMPVAPVTELGGRAVGNGRPGPMSLDLAARFERYADELMGVS
ncbi:MAG: aminotransferase class IV [Planctomycetota bacterium]